LASVMPRAKRGRFRRYRIGVLLGGPSAEREVSLVSGKAVTRALRRMGYNVTAVNVTRNLPALLHKHRVQVVFNALHGKIGEDGCVQGLLEVMGIPYTGSGVTASALCMDKVLAKQVFVQNRIPTAPYRVVSGESQLAELPLPLPLVVKPRAEGSAIGVTIVRQRKGLVTAVRNARQYDDDVLLEQYIPGKEVTVGLLNGVALGVTEIRPRKGFYDYETKYTAGLAQHVYPAPLPKRLYTKTMEVAVRACELLGCEGTPRVDLRITPQGNPYVLEINTLPGMTPLSLLPEIAQGQGLDFGALVETILDGARLKGQPAPRRRAPKHEADRA
jgi:D-alanine-D-alanine ligase